MMGSWEAALIIIRWQTGEGHCFVSYSYLKWNSISDLL